MLHDHSADLLHLIRLGMSASRLKVEDLLDPFLRENVVTASHAFSESDAAEEGSQLVERDRCIGASPEDPGE